MKSTLAIIATSLIAYQASCLSVILQNMEPYCFVVGSKRLSEVRVQYMISGLNEENVEF